ncbi:MAG: hypothetical protein MRY83_21710 [Flavobacteriales bacterium]|nr:hypothetical protein [Flavobacteriales bacterium]
MKIKNLKITLFCLFVVSGALLGIISKINAAAEPKICTFMTLMGEQEVFVKAPPPRPLDSSLDQALKWLSNKQLKDGGFSAASYHGVNGTERSDAATTAIAAMAFLRDGQNHPDYIYKKQLEDATAYLKNVLLQTPPDGTNISTSGQTQIQRKLGRNIDLILATQFLSNLIQQLDTSDGEYEEVFNLLNRSVDGMQQMQSKNGSFKSAGWAGVLQSALANNALEFATHKGAWVEEDIFEKSKDYHKSNFDLSSNNIKTADGAGVMLYAVSSTVRATAKEAKKAKSLIALAKTKGVLEDHEGVSTENLLKCGLSDNKAYRLNTAFQIYSAAKRRTMETKVQNGFGNNGGEEFLSHLQAGESFAMVEEPEWSDWFDNMSNQLHSAQKPEGYWQGHHCITSPVFCTATCILILSMHSDYDMLAAIAD